MSRTPTFSESVNWWILGLPPKTRRNRRRYQKCLKNDRSRTSFKRHSYRLRSVDRNCALSDRSKLIHRIHHEKQRHPYQLRSTTRLHKGDYRHIDLDTVARCGLNRSANRSNSSLDARRYTFTHDDSDSIYLSNNPRCTNEERPSRGWIVSIFGHMKSLVLGRQSNNATTLLKAR